MKFTIQVKGLKKAINTIKSYGLLLNTTAFKKYIAEKSIDEINKIAEERLQTSENYIANNKYEILDDGLIIYNDIQSDDGTYISLILEYGSGIHSQVEKFPEHTATYDRTGGVYWLVPVEKAGNLANTTYQIIKIKDVEYYMVFAQYPKHIYTDAAKIIRKEISTWTKEYIEMEMKSYD